MLTVLPLSCLLTLSSKSPPSLTIRIPTRPLPPSRLSHASLFHRIPPTSNIVLTHPVSAHTAPAPPLTHDYNNIRSQQQHTKITTTYEANTRTTINTSIISSTTFTPSHFHQPQLSQSLRLHHPPPSISLTPISSLLLHAHRTDGSHHYLSYAHITRPHIFALTQTCYILIASYLS